MSDFLLIGDAGGLTLASSPREAEKALAGTRQAGTLYRLERVARVNVNKAVWPAEESPPTPKKIAKKKANA
jgi:hypothetical protein